MSYEISYVAFRPPQVTEEEITTLAVVLKTPVDETTDPDGTDVTLEWSSLPVVNLDDLIDTPLGPAPTTVHIPANMNGVVLQVTVNPHVITTDATVVKVRAWHPLTESEKTFATLQVLKAGVFITKADGTELDPVGLEAFLTEYNRIIQGKQLPISVTIIPVAVDGVIAITDSLATVLRLESTLNLPEDYNFRVGIAFTVNRADDNSIVPTEDFFQDNPSNPLPPFFFSMKKDDMRVYSLRPQLLKGIYFVTITSTVTVPLFGGGKDFVHTAKVVKVVGK